jgi:hypothetical protein
MYAALNNSNKVAYDVGVYVTTLNCLKHILLIDVAIQIILLHEMLAIFRIKKNFFVKLNSLAYHKE